MSDRRSFLKHAALWSGSLAIAAPGIAAPKPRTNKLCYFTKHLQGLSYDEIAAVSAEMGVDGIEAPIRPKGHIEPEQVETELPKFVEALKKQNLEMTILTSGINEVSAEQHTEKVLRTAASLGIKRFRMLYYKYDLSKPILPQLDEIRPKIKDLVQFCKEVGIQPLFQNHSGKDYVAAPIWDMYSMMREYPVERFGFAFDILHATVEGGLSWPIDSALVADHYGAVYFKDFKWLGRKIETCPLGEGQVSPDFAKQLLKRNYGGPISLHVEYLKGNPKDPAVLKDFREHHATDVKTLKSWMDWA
ncbi:MAG TPA: TIM barrel protein [Prosthecobacter sp.]|nr:TIM barrel protein [Prosthecobacter sp.]